MAIGLEPIREVHAGLKKAWTDSKASFKEAGISINDSSKQVLQGAKDRVSVTLNKLAEENGKGLKLLGQSAGLLAVDATLAYVTSKISSTTPELATRASVVQMVFGLVNSGVAVFAVDNAIKLGEHMKSLKSK